MAIMSIEDFVEKKIYEMVNCVLNRLVKPTMKVDKVTQLDEKMIDQLMKKYGIKGVILDIDDTVRKNMRAIPPCNEAWINMIKEKLKVIVVSNGKDKRIEDIMKEKGIGYIGLAYKPLKRGFAKACERMHLHPEEVLVVGDSLWADIYGGKRNNMKTVLVKGVEKIEKKQEAEQSER